VCFFLWLALRVALIFGIGIRFLPEFHNSPNRGYLPISSLVSGHCGEETAYSEDRHELHETIIFSPRAWASAARWPMRGLRSNAGSAQFVQFVANVFFLIPFGKDV
jgi:hypothetical protein